MQGSGAHFDRGGGGLPSHAQPVRHSDQIYTMTKLRDRNSETVYSVCGAQSAWCAISMPQFWGLHCLLYAQTVRLRATKLGMVIHLGERKVFWSSTAQLT